MGTIKIAGRAYGKTYAMQKELKKFLVNNPEATIAVFRNGALTIEKPVHGEVLEQDSLPNTTEVNHA